MTTLAVAAAASTLSVGGAHAQGSDDGRLSGILCPLQHRPCHQFPTPTPPNGGGITGFEVAQNQVTAPNNPAANQLFSAECPDGKIAIAGGYNFVQPDAPAGVLVTDDRFGAAVPPDRWVIGIRNNSGGDVTFNVWASCVTAN
ncbi:hypothetical protein ACIQ6K_31515 [Streptomyces sp. NPDC096354]|uniref:hypothetical protein n=1 Tax=Streptomyces sp. NPDC096354 TaxID=3366088 RepID=UPI0037F8945D